MKRLMMACLLAVSSHGWATGLDPECYELYDQYLAATDWVVVGQTADKMHDMQCWPALQGSSTALPPATDCDGLVPHVIKMVNDQAHVNGYSILQAADAKAMTYETIDRVAMGHNVFMTSTDNRGRSMQVRQPLKHDDKIYVKERGYYLSRRDWSRMNDNNAAKYGNDGTVLVPNSEPFAASPLTGNTRTLDCSAEASFTQGSYLIQMYLDRNSNGQEFIGMQVLMELR